MNVHFGEFKRDGLAHLDDAQAEALQNVTVGAHDVLLNITGASIGRVCLAPSDMSGARVNQHVCIIRTVDELRPAYVERFLAAPMMQRKILDENYGFTRQALTKDMIEKFLVPVSPFAEQRRIIAKLEVLSMHLARARAELDRVAALARYLRSSALTSILDRVSKCPLVSIDSLSIAIFDGPFGSNLKSQDYTKNGVRVVRLENIGHLNFIADKQTFISEKKFQMLARHRLFVDDILFSSFIDREVRVCRFPGDSDKREAINKADCFVVRVNPSLCDPRFLTYALAAPSTYEAMKANVHGATRPRIGLSQLRAYEIHCPPTERQKELADQVDIAFTRADRLEAEAARARALLDRLEAAILTKAFRGELVPQDPNDEPANVLLERIKAARSLQAQSQPKQGPKTMPRHPRKKTVMTKSRQTRS
jgi:type I restriction enzyme S subunit